MLSARRRAHREQRDDIDDAVTPADRLAPGYATIVNTWLAQAATQHAAIAPISTATTRCCRRPQLGKTEAAMFPLPPPHLSDGAACPSCMLLRAPC
jgi:hypothetical protein